MSHQRNVSPPRFALPLTPMSERIEGQRSVGVRGGLEELHSSLTSSLFSLQADSGWPSAETEGFPTADTGSSGNTGGGNQRLQLPLSHIPRCLRDGYHLTLTPPSVLERVEGALGLDSTINKRIYIYRFQLGDAWTTA